MSSISIGRSLSTLDGSRWYAYSSPLVGDVGLPATVTLIDIPSSGLRNSFIKVKPFFGQPVSTAANQALGISILIDETEVFNSIYSNNSTTKPNSDVIELFIPRSSTIKVLSLNKAANNTQVRGCNILGWYV